MTGGFAAAAHHDPIAGPIGSRLSFQLSRLLQRPSAAGSPIIAVTYFRTLVIVHASAAGGLLCRPAKVSGCRYARSVALLAPVVFFAALCREAPHIRPCLHNGRAEI